MALLVVGAGACLHALPLQDALARLRQAGGEGPLAMLVFGAAYVAGALLLVPGAALTLAAGAAFGPWRGTAVVSLASTTAAALAFLIARHGARSRVRALADRHPAFVAVDRAIDEGGWRIVGLLRLSPLMPFSVENYLFGLTSVRFGPYVLASWAFMLPGTILYASIGSAGRAAVTGSRSPAEWALAGAGLAATAWVVVDLARRARRALAGREAALEPPTAPRPDAAAPGRLPALLPLTAASCLALGVWAQSNREALRLVAGPPRVLQQEAYAASGSEADTFDHAGFDALLARHVADGGEVDYPGLGSEVSLLDAYLESLASARIDGLGRDERLALLINAYNAFTLRLVLDHWPIASIKDIPSSRRWSARRWRLAGNTLSLDQLEHEEIRPKFREPRIHFALVCAARGCPPLRREAYVGARMEEQLDDQARYVHLHDRWLRWEQETRTLRLSELYRWYGGDFEQAAGSVAGFVGHYSPPVRAALAAGVSPSIRWMPYDWSLNQGRRPNE